MYFINHTNYTAGHPETTIFEECNDSLNLCMICMFSLYRFVHVTFFFAGLNLIFGCGIDAASGKIYICQQGNFHQVHFLGDVHELNGFLITTCYSLGLSPCLPAKLNDSPCCMPAYLKTISYFTQGQMCIYVYFTSNSCGVLPCKSFIKLKGYTQLYG